LVRVVRLVALLLVEMEITLYSAQLHLLLVAVVEVQTEQ
jgi:hypothetical protein